MARRRAKRDEQGGTVPLDFNTAPRAAQALRLRRLGHTYDQIAQMCGYANESGARKAIKTANARIIRDEAQALIGFQSDMIEQALQVVNKRIQADDKDSLWAVDRLVPLLKRYSELLGLDAKGESATGATVVVREYPQGVAEAV